MFRIINNRTIEIQGNRIVIPGFIHSDADGKPFVLEFGGLVIFNFLSEGAADIANHRWNKIDMNRNIWAYNERGEKVWEIEALPGFEDRARSYTSVFIEDGKLIGGNWIGVDVIINPKDGTVFMPKGQRPW